MARSSILYYESIGLLKRPRRTAGNYRAYGETDFERLRQICIYREAGLALADIRALLDAPSSNAAGVLRRRMAELGESIERMREHQRAIARLLQTSKQIGREKMITKQKWTEIMRAAGFSESDMRRWHGEFEKSAPNEHQEFLEFLHIPAEEVKTIRAWSARNES